MRRLAIFFAVITAVAAKIQSAQASTSWFGRFICPVIPMSCRPTRRSSSGKTKRYRATKSFREIHDGSWPIDEAKGPVSKWVQRICKDTLRWLISFSLHLRCHSGKFPKDSSDSHTRLWRATIFDHGFTVLRRFQSAIAAQRFSTWRDTLPMRTGISPLLPSNCAIRRSTKPSWQPSVRVLMRLPAPPNQAARWLILFR